MSRADLERILSQLRRAQQLPRPVRRRMKIGDLNLAKLDARQIARHVDLVEQMLEEF